MGQELVLSGHLRAGAGTGDLHRCHFSGGLSDVSGRVASRRLRLGLYPEEVSGFEDLFTEFSENLWLGLVDIIVVVDKKNFRVKFKSGMEVPVEL